MEFWEAMNSSQSSSSKQHDSMTTNMANSDKKININCHQHIEYLIQQQKDSEIS